MGTKNKNDKGTGARTGAGTGSTVRPGNRTGEHVVTVQFGVWGPQETSVTASSGGGRDGAPSKLPSKLPVSDGQGNVAGYITGEEAFPTPPPLVDGKLGKEPAVVVRDANGKQVGVMVPGKGFVPNGAAGR